MSTGEIRCDLRERRRQRGGAGRQRNWQFFALGGSGSVIGGGGNDMVATTPTDSGNWLIALGNGYDFICAFGSGNDTISTGSGYSILQLAAAVISSPPPARIRSWRAAAAKPSTSSAPTTWFTAIPAASSWLAERRPSSAVPAATMCSAARQRAVRGRLGRKQLPAGRQRPGDIVRWRHGDQLYAGGDMAKQLHAGRQRNAVWRFRIWQRHVLWRVRLGSDHRRHRYEYVRGGHRLGDGHGQPGLQTCSSS